MLMALLPLRLPLGGELDRIPLRPVPFLVDGSVPVKALTMRAVLLWKPLLVSSSLPRGSPPPLTRLQCSLRSRLRILRSPRLRWDRIVLHLVRRSGALSCDRIHQLYLCLLVNYSFSLRFPTLVLILMTITTTRLNLSVLCIEGCFEYYLSLRMSCRAHISDPSFVYVRI